MRIVSAGTQGKGGGERGGDESDAMDAAPTAVWRRPAQPGRGGRIRCVRWKRLQALRHQTPDTMPCATMEAVIEKRMAKMTNKVVCACVYVCLLASRAHFL